MSRDAHVAATTEPPKPSFLTAFDDAEWSYYVRGHDEDELLQVDELDALRWEKLWMREVPVSHAEDYGMWLDDYEDAVERDPATGRFRARTCWMECSETANGAEPWMGVKYAPA